jgi:hypothetical protein
VRADERGAHAVGDRGGDVAVEVVAGEQHLPGRRPGGGHQPVKERLGRIRMPSGYESKATQNTSSIPAFWSTGQRLSQGIVLLERTRVLAAWLPRACWLVPRMSRRAGGLR